jgi:hypothetical protein
MVDGYAQRRELVINHLVRLSYCGQVSELEEGIRRFCAYIKDWK